MITISSDLVTVYADFVSGSVQSLVSIIGITGGIFLAFAIFERVVRSILKAIK